MRQERTVQASIFDLFADHEIGQELKAMSQWLDEHRELIGLAAEDLRRRGVQETEREGLPAESVLCCALLKQHRQLSYEELAFHLEDSASFRAFARLPLSWTPKKSVLHRTISAIRAETWEAINRVLVASARQEKVKTGKIARLDSTVAAALMHEPSDSSLLWDAVLVMVQLLKAANALVGGLEWRNHRRAAKNRARAIEFTRGRPNRVGHKLTRATLGYADRAAALVWQALNPIAVTLWQAEFRHYRPLVERVIAQAERRVLDGEAVPANEKIVSLFEPQADIIVKGGRKVQYGHKLNLATGRSGLILGPRVKSWIKMLWGVGSRECGYAAGLPRLEDHPMGEFFDPRKPATAFYHATTLVAVLELSGKSWEMKASVPGVSRRPLRRLPAGELAAAIEALERWKTEARGAGHAIVRVVVGYEAGRDGFWIARAVRRQGIEVYVIHPASVAVERRGRRAKTDRIDVDILLGALLGWLRGEPRRCTMAPIPDEADEDMRETGQEREALTAARPRIAVRGSAACSFVTGLAGSSRASRQQRGSLAELRTPEGRNCHPTRWRGSNA